MPTQIDERAFAKLTADQKLGNIVSVVNMLTKKMIEVDTTINHNTDGIEMRLTLAQMQADYNLAKIDLMEKSAEDLTKGLKEVEKFSVDLKKANENLDKAVNESLAHIQTSIDNIQHDTETLKGITFRHSVKLEQLNEKVINLTARSMQNNINISGNEPRYSEAVSSFKNYEYL